MNKPGRPNPLGGSVPLAGKPLGIEPTDGRPVLYSITVLDGPATDALTVEHTGFVQLFAWGAGEGGNGGSATGGGGGAAFYVSAPVSKGERIAYSLGAGGAPSTIGASNPGGDTTVTLKGITYRAGGGGQSGDRTAGVSYAQGRAIVRAGGAGGIDNPGVQGQPGEDAGSNGGTSTSVIAGGGGSGGFNSIIAVSSAALTGLFGGAGGSSDNPGPGGGGAGTDTGSAQTGGNGRLTAFFFRI